MTRTVYGIGETICDIIFKDNHPQAAKPGGSTFNAMVSLGRMGVNTSFISKIGDDKMGHFILDFMRQNHISTENMCLWEGHKTDIALAFLNNKGDAEYSFYKEYDKQFVEAAVPAFKKNDILLFGSFFALNPLLRPLIETMVSAANEAEAIVYYDPNFRSTHLHEVDELMPMLTNNMQMSTIVRGSDEDFQNIFDENETGKIRKLLSPFVSQFIITKNSNGVDVCDEGEAYHFDSQSIVPVSTIGAGDSFNAGFIYALLHYGIGVEELRCMSEADWQKLVTVAVSFASNVCLGYENYISAEFEKNFSALQ